MKTNERPPVETVERLRDYGELRPGALGLPSALALPIAFIGPTVGLLFVSGLIVGKAGASGPFTFLVGAIGMLLFASTLAQFATRMSSAGGLYTFIARSLGTSTGFVMAWMFFLAYILQAPIGLNLFSFFAADALKRDAGLTVPWIVLMIFICAVMTALTWFSISRSMQLDIAFVIGEVVIVGSLLLLIMLRGGASGQIPQAFTPTLSPTGFSGIGLGAIFVVFTFLGFEGVTTIAEETRNPRRNIPIALIGSIAFTGVYFVLGIYAILVGYGTKHLNDLTSATSPVADLATRYVGHWYAVLVDLAALSAICALLIAMFNSCSRLFYALAREGVLPRVVARTHDLYKTPHISIGAYGVISLILAVFFAVLWTPFGAYGNLGFFSTLAILPLYVATNIALMAFIWTRYRSQFSWWLHGIFPVVATLVMIGAFITSVYPAPPSPLNIIGFVTIAWALIGIVWMLYLRARNRSRLDLIGRVLFADTKGVTVVDPVA